MAVAAGRTGRATVGAVAALHRDGRDRGVPGGASGAGDPGRRGQRAAFDRHRSLAGARMTAPFIRRRTLIAGGAGLALAGCDRVIRQPAVREIVFRGEDMHRGLQRALSNRDALAPEFRPDQMSPRFRTNGTRDPGTADYAALRAGRFADWRLTVDGLVARPLSLSLADIGAFPQRAQITRHDCVEG
ncbi:hypothetical protein LTR94_031013, partial [Friedmanniomyces endolithicus]